jgi:hypothetical protein
MAVITVDEALQHLGIDYADETVTQNVTTAVSAADLTLKGAVGADVETLLPNDARAKQLALLYMEDYYNERSLTDAGTKQGAAHRMQVTILEWQLKLEMRRLREVSS